MMKYADMVRNAPKKSEKQMWRSVEAISQFVDEVDECCPDIVRAFMIHEYEQMYGGHFCEEMAREEVGKMRHTGRDGIEVSGEVVSIEEARRITPNGDASLLWDTYVGANGIAHDLGRAVDDRDTLMKIAYEFWWCDDDYERADGTSKVWWYYTRK